MNNYWNVHQVNNTYAHEHHRIFLSFFFVSVQIYHGNFFQCFFNMVLVRFIYESINIGRDLFSGCFSTVYFSLQCEIYLWYDFHGSRGIVTITDEEQWVLLLLVFFHDASGLLANSHRKSFITKVIVQYPIFFSIMERPSIILTAYETRAAEINFWDTHSNQGRHLG